ncbi:MAG: hypothetical protein K0R85_1310 [Devosia sp.]|nr:hypothetical protein [Devosia sp.]
MSKRIKILLVVVVAVLLIWSVAWYIIAGQVRTQVAALAQADGVTNPRVVCENLNVTGYPFRFDVDCSPARITIEDVSADIAGIRASVLVYRPTHVLASALGPLSVSDAFTGSRNALDWSGLEASLRLDDWRISRFSVSAHDLVWTNPLMGEAPIATATLSELHLLDIPEQHDADRHLASLAGYARTQNLVYPALTLTDTNSEIQLELTGLPDDVRNWNDPLLLRTMQDVDATLRIVSARATDGASTMTAEGELRLDAMGQLEGQISIESTGVAERIGPYLQEPIRTLVLGTPAADGSHTNILSFSSGGVFSGLVPIGVVPPLF